jgi:hypothetical protein
MDFGFMVAAESRIAEGVVSKNEIRRERSCEFRAVRGQSRA